MWHPWTPGTRWIISDKIFGQYTPVCHRLPPRCLPNPTQWALTNSSLWRRQVMITFVWALPVLNGWMSRRTSSKTMVVLVSPSVHYHTLKDHFLGSQLCLPVDICRQMLTHSSLARGPLPRSWFQVFSSQGNPLPLALQWSRRAHHFCRSRPTCSRYSLETCGSVKMLEWSVTAHFANHIWQLRDRHLSILHQSVPKQTRESVRQAPLMGNHLFPEETVALAF